MVLYHIRYLIVKARVTRRVQQMEQELLTLPEHLDSSPVLVDSCFLIFCCLYSVLKIVLCPFFPFILTIVLSVLRFTASDNPFGIFKLFFVIMLECSSEVRKMI
jgi:hypothetical protein